MYILNREISPLAVEYFNSMPQLIRDSIQFYHIKNHSSSQIVKMSGYNLPKGDGTFEVWLDPSQEGTSFDITFAHEVTHCVMNQEGYPETSRPSIFQDDERVQMIGGFCSSYITDIEVNRRLKEFGFDVVNKYSPVLENEIRDLREKKEQRLTPPLGDHYWVCYMALKYMNVYFMFPRPIGRRYMREFQYSLPTLIPLGDSLIHILKENGYQTPADCRRSMELVVKALKLDELVTVK